jgi:hypothetical protein
MMHVGKARILSDNTYTRRVRPEADSAAGWVLSEIPDWRAESVFESQRQTSQHRLILIKPGEPIHLQPRVGNGDVLKSRGRFSPYMSNVQQYQDGDLKKE